MVLEINTSSKRRSNLDLFPSINKLCDYTIYGEKSVTIGTDAHQYSELTDNLEQAEAMVEELNLKPIIYQKRKRINL